MSGPKKSAAQLRREEKERIRKQRQLELERKKKEQAERLRREAAERLRKENILKCRSGISDNAVKIERMLKDVRATMQKAVFSKSRSDHGAYDNAESLIKKADAFLTRVNSLPNQLPELETILEESRKLKNSFHGLNQQVADENKTNLNQYLTSLTMNLNSLFIDNSIVYQYRSDEKTQIVADMEARIYWMDRISKWYNDYLRDKDISAELKQRIDDSINNLKQADSFMDFKLFYTNKISKIENKIVLDIEERKNLNERFNAVYADYALICEECGVEKIQCDVSNESIELMLTETEKMNEYLQNRSERERIRKIIDETMSELGYPVLANKGCVDQNGEYYRKLLFQYRDDKAMNMTITDDGQIAVEIGIMDNCSRSPSNAEAAALCDEMKNFCNDYKIIEQKLMEKGIEFTDRDFLPPSVAYAEIINVGDYGLEIQIAEDASDHNTTTQKQNLFTEEIQ